MPAPCDSAKLPALPAELTIYTAADCARLCLGWLDEDEAGTTVLRLDASDVGDVDAAGVQLLVALSNALHQRQRSLQLMQPSATLASACQRLGAGFLLDAQTVQEHTA